MTKKDRKKEQLRLRKLFEKYPSDVRETIWFIEVCGFDAGEILWDELKGFRSSFEDAPRDYFIYMRDLLTYWIEDLEHWDWGEEDEK